MPKAARSLGFSSPYEKAANMLNHIWEGKKSLKRLAYSPKDGSLQCSKVTYAQVCNVLSSKAILDEVLENAEPHLSKNAYNKGLLYVLLYELLLGPSKKIRGGGALKRKLMQSHNKLVQSMASGRIKSLLESTQQQRQRQCMPRYARVNTISATTKEVCGKFLETNNQYRGEKPLEFYFDKHIPNLLVFPPDILSHHEEDATKRSCLQQQQATLRSLVEEGKILLQDKASCIPAYCLMYGFSTSHQQLSQISFLDACAAPGNKTSHLASLVDLYRKRKGAAEKNADDRTCIYAFDRSPERAKGLQKRMEFLCPKDPTSNYELITLQQDFLDVDLNNLGCYGNVGGILLDPSCSGSGIYATPDRCNEAASLQLDDSDTSIINDDAESSEGRGDNKQSAVGEESHRIEQLAFFQEKALLHAMSFSCVNRIVYSTCSVHERENEIVVARALQAYRDLHNGEARFEVTAPSCMADWKRRGRLVKGLTQQEADCIIRANWEDETNGFFVCCLQECVNVSPKEVDEERHLEPSEFVPSNVKVYNGEFLRFREAQKTKRPKIGSDKAESSDTGMQNKTHGTKATSSNNETTQVVQEKILPKKVAKKIAWKKKQQEQGRKRKLKKTAR